MKIVEEKQKDQTLIESKIEINKEEIDEVYSKVMREIQKDFVAPGFRKGKVPFNIIESKLGQSYVFQKVIEAAIDQSVREYLSSINRLVSSILNIKLESASYEKIVYIINLEVEPLIELTDDIEIEVNKIELDIEQEINRRLNQIRDQFSSFVETDREVKEGDRVDIYFEIKDSSNDSLLAGGDNNIYQVLAVKEMLLPGVFENLVGMKKEQEKEFEIDGPNNIEQFKDKKLKVKIKVSNILEKRIPPDEELLKLVNYKSIEDLQKDIKKVIEQEKEIMQKDLIFSRYLAALKEKLDFDLPQTWLSREKDFQKNNFLALLKKQNRTLDDYLKSSNISLEDFEKNIENIAKDNIKRMIIINNLIRKYNINLDNVEIEYYLKNDVETQRYVMELSQLKLNQDEINYRLSQFIMMKKLKDEVAKKIKIKYIEQVSPTN